MKVLIVEDEVAAIRRLKRLLHECDPLIEVLAATDGIAATVSWLRHHAPPDLIFMDIQLVDGLSFGIFDRLDIQTPIIFCTAYDRYALDAFKVNSIDYLLKPIHKEELLKSLQKYRRLHTHDGGQATAFNAKAILELLTARGRLEKSRFLVRAGSRLLSIPTPGIAYFYSRDKITYAVTAENKRYPVDYALGDLQDLVSPQRFFRINRQYLVSIQSVESVDRRHSKLLLTLAPPSKEHVYVSREKATAFKAWLDQ